MLQTHNVILVNNVEHKIVHKVYVSDTGKEAIERARADFPEPVHTVVGASRLFHPVNDDVQPISKS